VPQDLTTFVSALRPTTECRNGRLPRITQRDAFTHGFRFVHTRTVKSCEPMGHSREPPVFARFGPTSDQTKFERVARYTPKRLPSRLWAITRRINPLQVSRTRTSGDIALLRRYRRGHHDGVSHTVHDLFIGRNNRRQNAPQNDVPRRNHEVIRTKTNPPSQDPDFPGLHI
jgi:hypothetical protein